MERPELSISVHRTADEAVLNLVGEIDMLTAAPSSTSAVNEVLTDPPPRIVLDMGGVTFCDSQGLGTLVVLSRRASHAAEPAACWPTWATSCMRVLDITGLRSALTIRNNRPTSVTAPR